MSKEVSNNKRIAKNTIYLYFRQLFSMVISLYTIRVVLEVLGAEDYGIYNVTGGLVVLFSFLNTTMSSATQRFLSFGIGKGDLNGLKKIFTQSIYTYAVIILLIVFAAETIGLWFLNNKLVIPQERMYAANVMYQFTILSFIATVISAPYNAAIAAKERMDVFAFVGVAGSLLQLVSVLFLKFCIFPDALIAYAVFIFINSFLVSFYSIFYCRKYFDFCQFVLRLFDRSLIKEMAFFAFWNMTATICNLLRNHGVNMLINMFFNPVVNAARAIAMQVSGAVNNFSYNFYTAVRPQLVKYYSSGNNDKMLELGYLSSRFSFLLLFALTVPIFCEAEGILSLWLKEVPDNTILFVRIVLIISLLEILTVPLDYMLQSSGRIKNNMIIISIINLANIPLSYWLLKIGKGAEYTMYINLILLAVSFIPRMVLCKRIVNMSVRSYIRQVLCRIAFVSIGFYIWIYLWSHSHLYWDPSNILCLIGLLVVHELFAITLIVAIGVTKTERRNVWSLLKSRFLKCS